MSRVVLFDSLCGGITPINTLRDRLLDSRLRGNDMIGAGNDGRWVYGLGSIRRDESNGTEEMGV